MQELIIWIQKFVIETTGWGFLKTLPIELWYILFMFVFGGVVLGVVMFFAGVASYAERKVAGHIQSRMGPMRVGPHGLLQFMADGIKLVMKEDLIPAKADRFLFKAAPYVLFAGTLALFAAIPYNQLFGKPLAITNLNIGLLYILAMSGFVVVSILMAGWASSNKWSLLGGMRSAAQIISYEVPVAVSFLAIIMIAGTMNMFDIVSMQEGGIWNWLIFRYPPFTCFVFLVYYVAAMAEVNRTPFDIPEAESELVAGFHTEYSGMRFAFFFMSEYANMLAVSAIATVLFWGGWHSVLPFSILPEPWVVLEGMGWFAGKTLFSVFLMMWLRWTLPRYRVDQLMKLCWKVLLPIAFANVIAIGIWIALT